MKWLPYLLALAIGFLLCMGLKPDPTEQGQAWLDSLNVERERSAVLARDSVRLERDLAAVGVRVAQQEVELTRLRTAGNQTSADLAHARRIAQEAQTALDTARSMADSLPRLVVAHSAQKVRADLAESSVANRDSQIAAGAVLLAAVRDSVKGVTAQRDTARAEATRWRALAERAEPVIDNPPNRWGRVAETGAMVAATYGACRDGLLTVGCIAGGLVTGKRFL